MQTPKICQYCIPALGYGNGLSMGILYCRRFNGLIWLLKYPLAYYDYPSQYICKAKRLQIVSWCRNILGDVEQIDLAMLFPTSPLMWAQSSLLWCCIRMNSCTPTSKASIKWNKQVFCKLMASHTNVDAKNVILMEVRSMRRIIQQFGPYFSIVFSASETIILGHMPA